MTHEQALRAILARLDGSNSTAAELRAMRSECQTIAREALEPQRLSSKGLAFRPLAELVSERRELAASLPPYTDRNDPSVRRLSELDALIEGSRA